MNDPYSQFTLNVQLNDFATFDNFVPGKNAELYSQLLAMLCDRGESFFYLWGDLGSGRTHLLQACCHHASEVSKPSVYWDLADQSQKPECFENLEQLRVICLDNLDVIAGLKVWEEALFHLYNRVREQGSTLIVAANAPLRQLGLSLPDLASRLAWGLIYQVEELSDFEKISALQLRAADRGLSLNAAVGQFLINHCTRNMRDLYSILSQLDDASLSAGRRLTIPFVKTVLEL